VRPAPAEAIPEEAYRSLNYGNTLLSTAIKKGPAAAEADFDNAVVGWVFGKQQEHCRRQQFIHRDRIAGIRRICARNGIGEIISAAETPLIARMSCEVTMSAESTVAMHCTSLR